MKLLVTKLKDGATLPRYAHKGDAGLDLCASEAVKLEAGQQLMVPTGIAVAVPEGHVGLIWDRSGVAAKHAVHCLAGVIDSGYRGEVKVVMLNHGRDTFAIEVGMRIAQLLIQPVVRVNVEQRDSLEDTKRGEGGFGSTGQ